jgi:hypothetical protein
VGLGGAVAAELAAAGDVADCAAGALAGCFSVAGFVSVPPALSFSATARRILLLLTAEEDALDAEAAALVAACFAVFESEGSDSGAFEATLSGACFPLRGLGTLAADSPAFAFAVVAEPAALALEVVDLERRLVSEANGVSGVSASFFGRPRLRGAA